MKVNGSPAGHKVVNSVTYFALIFKLVEKPRGGCIQYFHTYIWLGPYLGVQKNDFFWGMKKLLDIFGCLLHRFNLGDHFYTFLGLEWVCLGGHKMSNIYLGIPYIPDIFIGETVDAGYVCRVPPTPHWPKRRTTETTHGRIDPPN